jgi:2-polyprenyl-3-methyl-5-hydroxy-6-metoxy-1,4-benzoquinol methylase
MVSMLDEHAGYINDRVRRERLSRAIAQVVKPGCTVADVGCGSGVLGLMCLQAGAGFVHAIDATSILEVARETYRRAGWGQHVSLIRGRSQQVELSDRVDLLICDHVGYFGFDYGIVEFFTDARRRFLKPGGQMIPSRVDLKLAAVESLACVEKVNKWSGRDTPIEFHWVREHCVNTKFPVHLKKEELLGVAASLGAINFYEDQPEFFAWQTEVGIERDGVLHGLAGWFECELTQGICRLERLCRFEQVSVLSARCLLARKRT